MTGIKLDITNKKYRNILLLSYSTIATVAVAIVVVGVVGLFNVYTRDTIYHMAITQLNNLDNIIDNNLDTWRKQLQTAWDESTIRKYIYSNEEHWKEEYEAGHYLYRMSINNGVENFTCLFRNENEFKYFGWRYPEQEEREQIEKKIMETDNDARMFFVETDERRSLCVFLTERSSMGGKPQKGIIYAINLAAMEKQLVVQDAEDSMFLAFGKDGTVILQSGMSREFCRQLWEHVEVQGDSIPSWSGEITLEGNKYLSNGIFCEDKEIYFVMLQDYQMIGEQMSEIGGRVYLVVGTSFIIVFILAFWLANRLYFPLEYFFRRLSESDILLIDESYSKRQAEITSERILNQIHRISRQYHSDKVLRFLGSEGEDVDIPYALRLNDREEHCIMVLYWTSQPTVEREIKEEIYMAMERDYAECKVHFYEEPQSFCFLTVVKEASSMERLKNREDMTRILGRECMKLGDKFGTEIFCALSSLIEEDKDLRVQFGELQTIAKYHLLGQSSACMDAMMLGNKISQDVPQGIYDEIIELVKKGKQGEAAEKVPEIVDYLSDYEIKKALVSLAALCVRISECTYGLERSGGKGRENYLDHYIKLTSLYDRRELESYLEQLIVKVCLENSVYQEKTIRMNMLDAVSYIQEHYRDADISVEQVAEKYRISVSYFSKLFNEYVGVTFPEFISDLRLEYAREVLLSNQDISIKKVAEICGYGGTSYFSAQFKKKYNISPSAMRRNR